MNLNQNIIKKRYMFFISFLFIFFSCNSDDDHNVAVTGVTLDKEELSLEVGAESTLIATVTPTTATNKEVSWASDKPNIATVANGLVTAVAAGAATITVTASADNTKTDTVTVTVTESIVAVTGVNLDKEEFSLEVGAESTLIATVTPTTATNKEVTWASDKPNIATVDNGLVTAVAVGTATITVTASADNTKTDAVTVTVTSTLTGLSIADVSVTRGTTSFDISPTLIPSEATVDYELITNLGEVTMAGTRINIAADMAIGEYNITVKATGKDNYNGETRATFKLTIVFKNDDFVINFTDENFKNAVKSYLDITSNEVTYGDVKDKIKLSIRDKRITNMEEIIYFTSLRELNCSNNQLTSLDLSQNTDLNGLNCESNQLTSLDLSQNTDLNGLNCESNQLTSLDLSQNTVLEKLYCIGNQLTSLDISRNTNLKYLDCYDNQLTSLDLSQNTVLEELDCSNNQLTSLDLSQNTVLKELDCDYNQLTSLDLSQNTVLKGLRCYNNQLTSLDISQNTDLEGLFCYDNQLTSLDLSQNANLKYLYCDYNQLTSLDISQNTDLEGLFCYDNQLTSLDLSKNTDLEELDCSNNQLTSLDLSQNTDLKELYCEENQLTSLDTRGMRSVVWLSFSNTTLQTFKVHQNTKDHQSIIDLKTARGNDVTISTYSAPTGSTTYDLMCNDYVPRASGGSCND